jgi:hypothetical protein
MFSSVLYLLKNVLYAIDKLTNKTYVVVLCVS